MPATKTNRARRSRRRTYPYFRRSRVYGMQGVGAAITRGVPPGKPELKFQERVVAQADFIATGTAWLLNGIGLGNEVYNRIGRQIFMKNLELRGFINQQNGALNEQVCRVAVLYDRQSNGTAPTAAMLWDLSGATSYVASQYNLDNRDRFKVLYDKVLSIAPPLVNDSRKNIVAHIPLNLYATFNYSNTGTITDIQTGALYVVMVCEAPLGLVNLRTTFTTRVFFHEL